MRVYKAEFYAAIMLSDVLLEEIGPTYSDDDILGWLETYVNMDTSIDGPILLLTVGNVQKLLLDLFNHVWPEPPVGEIYVKMDI